MEISLCNDFINISQDAEFDDCNAPNVKQSQSVCADPSVQEEVNP